MYVTLPRLKKALLFLACGWVTILLVTHFKLLKHHKRSDFEAARVLAGNLLQIRCNGHVTTVHDRQCIKRLTWLKENAKQNVTGSECRSLVYLIYIEKVCPQPRDYKQLFCDVIPKKDDVILPRAYVRQNLYDVTNQLDVCGIVCDWIRTRIKQMENLWIEDSARFARVKGLEFGDFPEVNPLNKTIQRVRLKILVHMGLLTQEFGLNFGEGALAGGPLGELVQWSDLIACLHILGHDVIISWGPDRLHDVIEGSDHVARRYDLVYTDLVGLEQIRGELGSIFHYRCVLRVLDVYGTEPTFNHPLFNPDRHNPRTWGGRGLNPGQYLTHFPHSPDNSFLGFVVTKKKGIVEKDDKKVALLYGKQPGVLEGKSKEKLFRKLEKYFDQVHATMRIKNDEDSDVIPANVINHENLSQENFIKLLQKSKIYVGLGSPLEGPAPLEAVANGVTFINPMFNQPRSVGMGKPTNRKLTSQNPYAETRIGEPFVYTINPRNMDQIDQVLTQIVASPRNEPHVPFEFTMFGFLERVNSFVENQDFCFSDVKTHSNVAYWFEDKQQWPPLSALKVVVSRDGESCSSACSHRKMVCERTFFNQINSEDNFRKVETKCGEVVTIFPREELNKDLRDENGIPLVPCHAPSNDVITDACMTQSDQLLFSCACAPPSGVTRLCPCREYDQQMALCLTCS